MMYTMKLRNYIVTLLAAMTVVACQDSDVVENYYKTGDIVVNANIPTTRTAYTSENGVTKVTWVKDDAIGLVTNKQKNLRYTATSSGANAQFVGYGEALNVAEGDTVWAYYPMEHDSMEEQHKVSFYLNGGQDLSSGLAPYDNMVATGVVKDGEVNLQFKHLSAVLRVTVPTSLLQDDTGTRKVLTLESTSPVAGYNGSLDLKTGDFTIKDELKRIDYHIDKEIGDTSVVVCNIALLPQPAGSIITIGKFIEGSHTEVLHMVKLSDEGMQAGYVYTVTIDDEGIFEQAEIDREALMALYKATGGDNWTNNTNWGSDKPLSEWYGVKTTTYGSVRILNLDGNNLTGTLPPELGNLAHLTQLSLCGNPITGGVPDELSKLKQLERVYFNLSTLSGPLPLCFTQCERLRALDFIGNKFTGSIPKEYAELMNRGVDIVTADNRLSGFVPEEVMQTEYWKYHWGMLISGNQFYLPDFLHIPKVKAMTIDRNQVESHYEENKLTILFVWSETCGTSLKLIPILNEYYKNYKEKGLDIISHTPGWWSESVDQFVEQQEIKYPVIMDVIEDVDQRLTGIYDGKSTTYPGNIVGVIVGIDAQKRVLFTNLTHSVEYIQGFIDNTFSDEEPKELYTSTDYSNDGEVTLLQAATEGRGIDLVFMGDGYTDRLHADGTYDEHMRKGMEAIFMEEPYKSHRHLFNVYCVDVVSPNEEYTAHAKTAMECCFGEGTEVAGNDAVALKYALKALSHERMENAVISVVVNAPGNSGTCYMFNPRYESDYNNGLSIAYSTVRDAGESYIQVIQHEVGGHGFGKLGDEYYYSDKGHITYDELTSLNEMTKWGWYRNVSADNDLNTIKWKHFINDPRYARENLGAYEGAFTYITGAYRPTMQSIMNQNIGGFNAPSREAIYYRINKLAYGDSWEYDYETFVQHDLAHRTTTRSTATEAKPFVTAPPVVVKKHWSELLK